MFWMINSIQLDNSFIYHLSSCFHFSDNILLTTEISFGPAEYWFINWKSRGWVWQNMPCTVVLEHVFQSLNDQLYLFICTEILIVLSGSMEYTLTKEAVGRHLKFVYTPANLQGLLNSQALVMTCILLIYKKNYTNIHWLLQQVRRVNLLVVLMSFPFRLVHMSFCKQLWRPASSGFRLVYSEIVSATYRSHQNYSCRANLKSLRRFIGSI